MDKSFRLGLAARNRSQLRLGEWTQIRQNVSGHNTAQPQCKMIEIYFVAGGEVDASLVMVKSK